MTSGVEAVLVAMMILVGAPADASTRTGAKTRPAVGGYSNTAPRSESAAAGIVTQVEGVSFFVRCNDATAKTFDVGTGVLFGDRVWVEDKALLRVTDGEGNRITVAGPATFEFVRLGKLRVFHGSVKLKSDEGKTVSFESALLSGNVVGGEAAVWASATAAQVLALSGDVRAWHPQLENAAVLVMPGHFSETLSTQKHLHPRRATRVTEESFQAFLSRFDRSAEAGDEVKSNALALIAPKAQVEVKDEDSVTAARKVASVKKPAERVTESPNEEIMERFRARMVGRDYESVDEVPLRGPGPKRDAYGDALPSRKRGPASAAQGPKVEMISRSGGTSKNDAEHRAIKKSLDHALKKAAKAAEANE